MSAVISHVIHLAISLVACHAVAVRSQFVVQAHVDLAPVAVATCQQP
jgi:hypothetical protein